MSTLKYREEGFSPMKVQSKFAFFDTVHVEKRTGKKGDVIEVYRASLTTMEEAEEWLENYSLSTHTRWNKLYSRELKHYTVSLTATCQKSQHNKKSGSPRNSQCPASIHIRVKNPTDYVLKRDKYVKSGCNNDGIRRLAEILVNDNHNHHLLNAESLRENKLLPSAICNLNKIFSEGHSPSGTRKIIQADLRKKVAESCSPTKGKFIVAFADSGLHPTISQVKYRHKVFTEQQFGKVDGSPVKMVMEKIEDGTYSDLGAEVHTIEYGDGDWSIVIVTPVMKRVQETEMAGEVAYIDSTGHVDGSLAAVTVISAITKAGAAPLCVIITKRQTENNFRQAFELFRCHHPTAFGGNVSPQAFMSDDSSAERNSLRATWPSAKLMLCLFHVFANQWKWLMANEGNNVRQGLMAKFKSAAYAEDITEFDEACRNIDMLPSNHEPFKKKFAKFTERALDWALFARQDLLTRGNETNNYSEITMRLLKEEMLQRRKSYNPASLVEDIVGDFEDYLKKRLLEHATGRHAKHRLMLDKILSRVKIDPSKIIEQPENQYLVPSEQIEGYYYQVDASGLCECPAAMRGRFCKHAALLVRHRGATFLNGPAVNADDLKRLALLALGKHDTPTDNFFLRKTQPAADKSEPDSVEIFETIEPTILTQPMDARETSIANMILEEDSPSEQAVELRADILREFESLLDGAIDQGMSYSVAKKGLQALTKANKLNDRVNWFVSVYQQSTKQHKRRGRILVNPAAIQRRAGISRSRQAQHRGRPRNGITKRNKTPRNLAAAVAANRSNASSH